MITFHWTPTPKDAKERDMASKVDLVVKIVEQLVDEDDLAIDRAPTVVKRLYGELDQAFPHS